MGTATPPPPVIGDACHHCDDVLWLPNQSPQFIHVEFKDLVKCPGSPLEPPNAIFVLKQSIAFPCLWEFESDEFGIGVGIGVLHSEVLCVGRGIGVGFNYFWHQAAVDCLSDFVNFWVACAGLIGSINGTAHITWS